MFIYLYCCCCLGWCHRIVADCCDALFILTLKICHTKQNKRNFSPTQSQSHISNADFFFFFLLFRIRWMTLKSGSLPKREAKQTKKAMRCGKFYKTIFFIQSFWINGIAKKWCHSKKTSKLNKKVNKYVDNFNKKILTRFSPMSHERFFIHFNSEDFVNYKK